MQDRHWGGGPPPNTRAVGQYFRVCLLGIERSYTLADLSLLLSDSHSLLVHLSLGRAGCGLHM